jgi:hypothetical protein
MLPVPWSEHRLAYLPASGITARQQAPRARPEALRGPRQAATGRAEAGAAPVRQVTRKPRARRVATVSC